MWSDSDTHCDYLNFGCVADTTAELISEANGAPLSIGVSGGWGVGKSSMLNLISDALEKKKDERKKYVCVKFNAWLYQGYDDARTALMEIIAEKLVEQAEKDNVVLTKAKEFLESVNWLRVAGLTAGTVASAAIGLPPIGLLGTLWNSWKGVTDGNVSKEDMEKLDKAGKDTLAETAKLSKPRSESPIQKIHKLRQQFQETLNEMETTLVVFIDDLDRCLPSTAISTLEAIRLFLFLPRTAFIIAADDKMIRQAVRVHFKDIEMNNDLVTNYFDKLIQIPLRVPPLGTQEVRAYLMLLYLDKSNFTNEKKENIRQAVCKKLSESWKGHRVDFTYLDSLTKGCSDELRSNLKIADRLAPLMASATEIAGNPRLIKRFLNTLWIRLRVARAQNVIVEESTLAKVLLFERCAPEAAYKELVTKVNNGDKGRPEFLYNWEKQALSGQKFEDLKGVWKNSFVESWLALEPSLAEVDLRSVIYISRETMQIITEADQMSTKAQELLEALLKLKNINSTLKEHLQNLPGREHYLMADRLLVRARRVQKWGRPSVFWAFLALIEVVPEISNVFIEFLKSLDPNCLDAAFILAIGSHSWAQIVLDTWKNDSNTPTKIKKAIDDSNQTKGIATHLPMEGN